MKPCKQSTFAPEYQLSLHFRSANHWLYLSRTMKASGIAMLIAGFLWIGWDTTIGFVDDQHTIWISESQHMPPGDVLTRDQASGAMRKLSLALKDRHRVLFLPALLMLVGGLTATFSHKSQKCA